MQGTSSWLWRFNCLLLRLLGEISLSLLCSQSSWCSALYFDLPLRVGHLRASVLHSDRTGLKEQLIRGLWLTQAEGVRGMDAGRACGGRDLHDVAPAWGRLCVLLGKLSLDHGTQAVAGCTGAREGTCGEWPVLAHRLLGGCSSSLSISRPSLELLYTAFLILSPRTPGNKEARKISCLFCSSRIFPRLPPS